MALPPATPAQAPTARRRCSGGKVLVIVDNVAGMTSAAPTPRRPRRTISDVGPLTVMAAAEAPPKTTRPAIRARRRP